MLLLFAVYKKSEYIDLSMILMQKVSISIAIMFSILKN